ncbi:hypothetical protein G5V58_20470 [Nocardioides anomalus]|uniref:Uncharacterized protein n=1 Tax=Nocardioides anomalus TaxID=2712223 RepID=A0A6G6WI03_9ACTN|nr:hypothetical protein [Nocardioides anomalus]QIG44836.1 hypothetical protein G5V58_20470 [Nocardioides anomalus]
MDTDLAARLDASLGPVPEDPDPLPGLVREGRRAVRRRRAGVVGGAVAAVVVVVGGASLASGGTPDRAGPAPFATEPTAGDTVPTALPTAAPPTVPAPDGRADLPPRFDLATYDEQARQVVLHPGTTALQRVDDPYDLPRGQGSVGLELAFRGSHYYWMLTWGGGGTSMAAAPASSTGQPLAQWLEEQDPGVVTQDVPGTPSDLVGFASPDGELLVPRAGVVVLDHREGVDVGPDFASAADDTAAAQVRVRSGAVFYVLARRPAGAPERDAQYIEVAATPDLPDLDAFLAFAREQYAGGSGLL